MDEDALIALLRQQAEAMARQAEAITRQQAEAATLNERISELTAALVAPRMGPMPSAPSLTLDELFAKFMPAQQAAVAAGELALSTAKNRRNHLGPMLRTKLPPLVAPGGTFGSLHAATLTWSQIDEVKAARIGSETKRRTRLTMASFGAEFAILQRMLNWAVERKLLTVNAIATYRLRRPRIERETEYDDETIDRILEASNVWMRAIVLLIADAGLRPIECLRIDRAQVEWQRAVIRLRPDQTKNRKARTARLSPRCLAALKAIPEVLRQRKLFFRAATGRVIALATVDDWWEKIRETLKIEGANGETARLYDLRACLAGDMIEAAGIDAARRALGQSDFTQLARYARRREDTSDRAHEALEQLRADRRRRPRRAAADSHQDGEAQSKSSPKNT